MDDSDNLLDIEYIDIEPRKIYPLKAVANSLGYTSRTKVAELARVLKARGQGDSKKVLGENLLTFMGSPTISTMQMAHLQNIDDIPPIPRVRQGGAVTQEEFENMKPVNQSVSNAAGAAVKK